ncbi:restriction endonuclease subunit S [Microbacterium sp. zg.Y1090]|uniref:restriction endonuclease subunit S n=1 Tax=Microbacterium wangruii TaxID=3049073 RepID=UPI00214D4651|nr:MULTISPECIES: restriction endonuclease subunit S [unclassified Microbacterium]MCR2818932.1 restriction endonuclease subunit S [Microbacterium sp. zg.Y1090]WIM27239.1 restriction endonuclease subunit S [Microbacterium sp. zg-Y1090]
MAPAKTRGSGALLVNMKEIFAFDLISDQKMERAPLPARNPGLWLLQAGDLLFARQSLTLAGAGKVSMIKDAPEPMTFESHLIRVRLDPTVADSRFYYYFFRSAPGRVLMESIVEQVAAAGIRATDLSRLAVPHPEIDEQRRVADLLSSLDELADHNRSEIARIRELSAALYAAATRSPQWVPFEEVARLSREAVKVADLDAAAPYVALEHFGTDGEGLTGSGRSAGISSGKSRFKSGDVLYGKLRPYFRKFDRPGFDGVCSTEIWVLRPQEGWGAATVNALVARPEFTDFAMAGSGGTRMPRASWAHVGSMPTPVPPAELRGRVEAQLEELWRASVDLASEAVDVTRTRDELLPLLMSGKVRVGESSGVG